MYNKSRQIEYAKRYGLDEAVVPKTRFVEAFDKTTLGGLQQAFKKQEKVGAAAIYVDIANFSNKVDGFEAEAVGKFLEGYYRVAIPPIYKHGGWIDHIIGDGIVAVFSPFLSPGMRLGECEDNAYEAAKATVQALQGTEMAAKGAVSTGDLLFCQTGLEDLYTDYTVVGTPLTELHRLEGEAGVDQVWLRADTPLGKRVKSRLKPQDGIFRRWTVGTQSVKLRGVNNNQPVPVLVANVQRPKEASPAEASHSSGT